MEYYNDSQAIESKRSLSAQISRVYGWMFIGLVVSAFTAFLTIADNSPLLSLVANRFSFILLIVAEFGLVWFLSSRAMKMTYAAAAAAFLVYSILNGLTLSVIFYAYTLGSIYYAFLVAAGFFGFMCVYGLITKTDLTSIGSLLIMGLFGIIIASLVNLFIGSSMLNTVISFVGVAVFLGLTAYDSQKIKNLHYSYAGTDREKNVGIIGALQLYLDFINLFLFILRILGKRR